MQDGKLRLSMEQLVAAVVENNLTIASARYYPWIGQTDLLRARSGSSPRGVDATTIPSGVFAGAVGGSILGTAGGSGGGSSNPGGITGSAGASISLLRDVFDPSFRMSFSRDHTRQSAQQPGGGRSALGDQHIRARFRGIMCRRFPPARVSPCRTPRSSKVHAEAAAVQPRFHQRALRRLSASNC